MTDPLTGLDRIAWDTLEHAYGTAADTPGLLRGLRDPDSCEKALGDLYASILHQGTIYPATLAALGFLADLAADTSCPCRPDILYFLVGFAESIALGWASNPHYLPEGTDMPAFEAASRRALLDAARTLTPCLADDDIPVRALTAQVTGRALRLLPERGEETGDLLRALRERLALEAEPPVRASLVVALAGARPRETLRTDGEAPVVRLAAAWARSTAGGPMDGPTAQILAETWDHAPQLVELGVSTDPLEELVATCGAGATPLLREFAARARAEGREGRRARRPGRPADGEGEGQAAHLTALTAATLLAVSRSARPEAARRLRELVDLLPLADPLYDSGRDLRREVLTGLLSALGADPADPASPTADPTADAVVRLVRSDPAPGSAFRFPVGVRRPEAVVDVRADAAPALCAVGDPRGVDLALEACAAHPAPAPIMARCGGRTGPLASALARTGAAARPDLLAEARRRTAADPRSPDAQDHRASWMELVASWPADVAREAWPEVLLALPHVPRPACDLLGSWGTPQALGPLEDLAGRRTPTSPGPEDGRVWACVALGRITGEGAWFDRALAAMGERRPFLVELLDAWAPAPTARLVELCRELVDGTAARSFPDRRAQLRAARTLAAVEGRAAVWPTVLVVVDAGEQVLGEAARCALDLLAAQPCDPDARSLAALLADILSVGRATWSSRSDLRAQVEAGAALVELTGRAPGAQEVAEALLRSAVGDPGLLGAVPRACDLLVVSAGQDPAARRRAADLIAGLLAGDRPVASFQPSETVQDDRRYCARLARTLGALTG